MNLKLANKSALITGASQGIGREIALQLAHEGVRVVITSSNIEKLKLVAREIETCGGSVACVEGNAATEADLINIANEAVSHFGDIDILINNVGGVGQIGHFDIMSTEEWVDLFKLNVMSGLILTKHLKPMMQKNNWGRVIFLSSERAIEPKKNLAAYSMTKAAILSLAKSLSNELGEYGITVNCISPGVIMTPSWDKGASDANTSSIEFARQHSDHVLSKDKIGLPEDVANLVSFLCSDLARWITGSNFRVDGGSVKNIQI